MGNQAPNEGHPQGPTLMVANPTKPPRAPLTEADLSIIRSLARQLAIRRLGARHPRVDILAGHIVTTIMAFDSPDPIQPTELQRFKDGWPVHKP
jgi:hypothetical protein